MVSSPTSPRSRKPPAQRRAEIVEEASRIALEDGLERITLRAVAEGLGVRPGLISHYFPAAEDLVVAAFTRAVSQERARLITAEGSPLQRIGRFVARIDGREAEDLSRLWLNARHLCRFSEPLTEALLEQEDLDRTQLTGLIQEGIDAGEFAVEDAFAACVRIFVAVDGVGAYVNDDQPFPHEAFSRYVADVAEWSLGIPAGGLRALVDSMADDGADEAS